ncbi:DUF6249 domain-containing protein [Mangrovivirga sp. M17]|uniref:DUF6249 domain-containing protein n=1 Tax=Mangrovivirga halotolerans TaxID=2993936 RepID=A0ABT3RPF2_9BACT|nr:DUF6249 domain-containing protein [Mangrovivirga halotolerans]MCX2743361.1 DUF6249 domain-containing protein [Mangrovivirga halotolerans]
MNQFLERLPIVFVFISVAIVVIYYFRNKHKEKMELIAKGESIIHQDALEQMKLQSLSRGIIASFVGTGIFVAHLVATFSSLDEVVSYFSIITIFFGLGSLIFHFIIKNR